MKSYYNNWVIGQILTSKYHFVFNTDQRQIGFYDQVNIVDDNSINVNSNNVSIYLTFTAVIFTVIGIVIGIIIGIKYCAKKQRKKRANELLDNNEYNYNNNNGNIN